MTSWKILGTVPTQVPTYYNNVITYNLLATNFLDAIDSVRRSYFLPVQCYYLLAYPLNTVGTIYDYI